MFSALLGDMICLYFFSVFVLFNYFHLLVIVFILIVRFSHSVMTPKKTIDNGGDQSWWTRMCVYPT